MCSTWKKSRNVFTKVKFSQLVVQYTERKKTLSAPLEQEAFAVNHWWRCLTGFESMAALRFNCTIAPTYQRRARGWTIRKYRFSSLRYDPTGNRTKRWWRVVACSTNGTTKLVLAMSNDFAFKECQQAMQ